MKRRFKALIIGSGLFALNLVLFVNGVYYLVPGQLGWGLFIAILFFAIIFILVPVYAPAFDELLTYLGWGNDKYASGENGKIIMKEGSWWPGIEPRLGKQETVLDMQDGAYPSRSQLVLHVAGGGDRDPPATGKFAPRDLPGHLPAATFRWIA